MTSILVILKMQSTMTMHLIMLSFMIQVQMIPPMTCYAD